MFTFKLFSESVCSSGRLLNGPLWCRRGLKPGLWCRRRPECFAAPCVIVSFQNVRKVEMKPGALHGAFSLGGCKHRAKCAEGFRFGDLRSFGGGFTHHTKLLRQSLLILLQLPPTVALRENTQPAGGDFASSLFHLPALWGESQYGVGSHWLSQYAALEVLIKELEPLQSDCVGLYSYG